jgi:CMP-N-acetylneuraminic acid synthetase
LPATLSILQSTNPPKQADALRQVQQALEEQELKSLWASAVDRNPVIRFSLEKLATPTDLQNKHSSQFFKQNAQRAYFGGYIGRRGGTRWWCLS